ncbi:MAG: DUF309 domain-containing protein [Gemmatimonadales bacterium]
MTGVARMRDVVIVGGGCYGTFYATQLARARAGGKADFRRVIVVDRDPACRANTELGAAPDREFVTGDWADFFDALFAGARPTAPDAPADFIVPSPHMPHLMFEWVLRRARRRWPGRAVEIVPVPGMLGTPYDRTAADHTRYVSFADWVCPTHCVEPDRCPAIGSRRTWDMAEAAQGLAQRLRLAGRPLHGPALFVCRHHVFGVGTFAVDAVLAGDRLVARAGASGEPAEVLIGTVSRCHGALNLLRLGEGTETAPVRRAVLERARDLFNAGEYWAAHEALETVWRSILRDDEARVWQGLIQAAAALLHRARGNRHGVEVVGGAALEKLAGPQHPAVEFETVRFRAQLARALAGEGDLPRLEVRAHDQRL